MTAKIRVMVIEPNSLRRQGMKSILTEEGNFDVTITKKNVSEAFKESEYFSSQPDVVVTNIDCHKMKKVRSWALLRFLFPSAQIVAMTDGQDRRMLEWAIAAGCSAIQPTDVEPDDLFRAIRNASKGVIDYNPELLNEIKAGLSMTGQIKELKIGELKLSVSVDEVCQKMNSANLTNREKEVIIWLCEGMTNRQIAQELNITVRTIEFHVSNILRKLGVESRAQVILIYQHLFSD